MCGLLYAIAALVTGVASCGSEAPSQGGVAGVVGTGGMGGAAGVAGEPGSGGAAGYEPRCLVPGSMSCSCGDGAMGISYCVSPHYGWGPCECSEPADGGGFDAGGD
jgi:hypothetical protein